MGCSVSGCDGSLYVRGMCSKHYNRLLTTGTVEDGPRTKGTLADRFWRKVERRGRKQCWLWTGVSKCTGYGYIGLGTRKDGKGLSHRVAWELTNGPIPAGKVVRHMCHNRLCCNPSHLRLGTQTDNVKDMWARKGGPKGNARLTEADVVAIRADLRSSRQLASVYSVSDAHIRAVRNKRAWGGL